MSEKPKTLRFRARATACVPNYELEVAGIRAFLGRKLEEVEPGRFGFAPTNEIAEVPYRAEYVKHAADGDLWAADEATAKACGVKFDPTFGGEKKGDEPVPAAAAAQPEPAPQAEPAAEKSGAAAPKKTTDKTPAAAPEKG